MANIFKQNRDVTQHPNRNNFDLSYRSHSTFKFGYLYPVFKRKVVPGDSFRIRSAFDLKMHAIQFPVQSQIRAHMHFFYVRNKNLWEHFEDYMTGQPRNTPYVHPYLQVPDTDFKNGSIHDFLGVPTSAVTKSAVNERSLLFVRNNGSNLQQMVSWSIHSSDISVGDNFNDIISLNSDSSFKYARFTLSSSIDYPSSVFKLNSDSVAKIIDLMSILPSSGVTNVIVFRGATLETSVIHKYILSSDNLVTFDNSDFSFTLDSSLVSDIKDIIESGDNVFLSFGLPDKYSPSDWSFLINSSPSDYYFFWNVINAAGTYDYSSLGLDLYTRMIHLDALPYRAYESIYRAFYANDVWQPLIVNGEKEYNTFNTNRSDGADSTPYGLFKRNYELDFLTSALPSPQSGNAPLVGISALGNITVESEDGVTNAVADVDGNGNITGVSITSPLASVNHARTLMNIASLGMNINDFRNANALQKLLEQTMRSGYRYLNFTKGHYGVAPKDNILGMPEFIGGYSRDVQVTTVVSGSDTFTGTYGKELGEYGGNGRVVGGSNHDISHFCDDHGWIIGVMCITPTPAYSQLLPKENICPRNYLDYYFPEMAQLGMQAIPYTEVCPIQAYIDYLQDNSKKLTDTFGYQRPNYDMVASVDEVHGDFRGSLKDYLINRQFDGRPELGSDFLQVNPEEINDIFINRNPYDDVFIGHLAFQVYAKRPVPRIHVPSL